MPSDPAAPIPARPGETPPARRGPRAALARLDRPATHALLVALAAAVPYAGTLEVPFLLDDRPSIEANPRVQDVGAWLAALDWRANRSVGDLTFALNRWLGGLDVAGYHAVNVLLHVACALLVLRLATLLLASPFVAGDAPAPPTRAARWTATVAALAFAVHPVQTGAVTYVVQRYAVLATALYLGALVLWLEGRRRATPPRAAALAPWAGALVCALLAMRTKEIAFTLPAAILLADLLFLRGPLRPRLAAFAPFAATMLVIPAALLAGRSVDAVRGVDAFAAQAQGTAPLSRLEYLLTEFRVLVTYLRLLVLPVGQTFDYDFPPERTFSPAVAASLALLLAVVAAAIALVVRARRGDRRLRIAGFGILWIFLALSVESSVIPIDDVIFEHRLYLPSVGFALAAASLLAVAWDRLPAPAPRAWAALPAAWLLALAGAAAARNAVWADPIAFFQDDVEKAPGKARVHQSLGVAYSERGRTAEALAEWQAAVRLAPRDALARYNLGMHYYRLGLVDPALRELEAVVQFAPASPATRTTLAALYRRKGLPAEAERELRAALAQDPRYLPARAALEALRRDFPAR